MLEEPGYFRRRCTRRTVGVPLISVQTISEAVIPGLSTEHVNPWKGLPSRKMISVVALKTRPS